ncbi:MAG: potassium channel family protein [Candidatus Micrarchaeia archaeon]
MFSQTRNMLRLFSIIIGLLFVVSFVLACISGLGYDLSFIWILLNLFGIYYPDFIPTKLYSNPFIVLADIFGSIEFVLTEAMITAFFYDFIEPIKLKERSTMRKISKMHDHFILVNFNNLAQSLIQELENKGKKYVVLTDNEKDARFLYASSKPFLIGSLDSAEILRKMNVSYATAVILCGEDTTKNAILALSIREISKKPKIVARVNKADDLSQLVKFGIDFLVEPEISAGITLGEVIKQKIETR